MTRLYITAIAATLLTLSACTSSQKKNEPVKVDARGIPESVSAIIMGDSCNIDTIYTAGEITYRYIDNNQFFQKIIFDNDGLIVNNPTLQIDSLGPGSYRISDLVTSVDVDFADAESVRKLKETFPVYKEFNTVTYHKSSPKDQGVTFSLLVETPGKDVAHSTEINRWLAATIDTIPFDGNFRHYGETLAKDFFDTWPVKERPLEYYENSSIIVYRYTPRYITFFSSVMVYTGGAHGMYAYHFPTYLLGENKPLTTSMAIKGDALDNVRDIIYQTLAQNDDFVSNHNLNSALQVRRYVESFLDGEPLQIPSPGLLPEGMVFCYQPYEIGSYADGAFQLIIPYDKLRPYLTAEILEIIK